MLLKTLLVAMFALKTVAVEGSITGTVQKLNLYSSSFFHVRKFNNEISTKSVAAEGNPDQRNLITSPFSMGLTLAMATCGAQGQTLDQFKKMFNISPADKIDISDHQAIIDDLNNIRENELIFTNKVFIAEHFHMNGVFKNLIENYYHSVAQAIDFTAPEIAANTMNTWVKENTKNHIHHIFDNLDEKTKLVLVDAVYFKGQWEEEFDPKFTQNMAFNVDNNTVRYVPTMHRQGTYQYGEHADLHAKFVVIPYKVSIKGKLIMHRMNILPVAIAEFVTTSANELSLVIIIPNKIDGLERLERKLQNMRITEFLNQGQDTPLKLYLPKFKVEKELDVATTLQKLGLIDAFTESADFSGIASGHLHISKVLQKVIIEVDEQGTEVPGAGHTDQTSLSMTLLSKFFYIHLNSTLRL
ncbi:serine protease inhibitor 3/4-like [Xylocopa sonorina]|uniref:serine protease inhibitor 3/4-like n=1 Tax=Xylocopa sonorina TaxID=1818115 RepID=UPI00403AE9E9